MTIRATTPSFQDCKFLDSKVARFVEVLREAQFTGKLVWSSSKDEKKWSFYFYLGRICYATGGTHSVRRWARNLAAYCPHIQVNITQLQHALHQTNPANLVFGWEYYLFCLWIEQKKITCEEASQAIEAILSEVLLDLSQAEGLTYHVKQIQSVPKPLVWVDGKTAFIEAQKLCQNCWKYNIELSFLDRALLVKYPERLQGWISTEAYQALPQLLDGEKTLRDLATQAKLDIVQVARSLLPHIQSGLVELVNVPDLPEPVYPTDFRRGKGQTNPAKPLIACVDDSVIVCWTMEKLLTAAGYEFISINDGFRAITTLLHRKPDLIFLDVFMPGTNGYEICRNLRKAPSFQDTPIVFLTGLDGVVDQVRARLAGASDFLSKPIDADRVLNVIAKYLSKGAIVP